MKKIKYALLDTDFISKTYFIHGTDDKRLSDLVVAMPEYCFFCHSQIIKELSSHNQHAIGWLQCRIEESKIQCYTDESILNELMKIRGDFAFITYAQMLKEACDAFSKYYFEHTIIPLGILILRNLQNRIFWICFKQQMKKLENTIVWAKSNHMSYCNFFL